MLADRMLRGIRIPGWLYGTAWKEDATESLVVGALTTGFRGLDTANQRKHYDEAPGKLEDEWVYRRYPADWQTYQTRYVTSDTFRNALRNETAP